MLTEVELRKYHLIDGVAAMLFRQRDHIPAEFTASLEASLLGTLSPEPIEGLRTLQALLSIAVRKGYWSQEHIDGYCRQINYLLTFAEFRACSPS